MATSVPFSNSYPEGRSRNHEHSYQAFVRRYIGVHRNLDVEESYEETKRRDKPMGNCVRLRLRHDICGGWAARTQADAARGYRSRNPAKPYAESGIVRSRGGTTEATHRQVRLFPSPHQRIYPSAYYRSPAGGSACGRFRCDSPRCYHSGFECFSYPGNRDAGNQRQHDRSTDHATHQDSRSQQSSGGRCRDFTSFVEEGVDRYSFSGTRTLLSRPDHPTAAGSGRVADYVWKREPEREHRAG